MHTNTCRGQKRELDLLEVEILLLCTVQPGKYKPNLVLLQEQQTLLTTELCIGFLKSSPLFYDILIGKYSNWLV